MVLINPKKILTLDLGFGDSGKGKVVEWLCRTNPNYIVVRYSGSSQCGHTVKDTTRTRIYSSLGSGTHLFAPTYIGKNMLLNPVKFLNEYDDFCRNVFTPTVYIHPHTELVTPFDIFAGNVEISQEKEHGTCGQGVYRTVCRVREGFHLHAVDLFYPEVFVEKVRNILLWVYKGNYKFDVEFYRKIANDCAGKIILTETIPQYFNTQIYETNQGLLLDEHIGIMPHCTPTHIIPDEHFDETYLITRSYVTRHGKGPLLTTPCEYTNPHETNVDNEHQGEFRTGYLNINLLQYAVQNIPRNLSHIYNLVINHLDINDTQCLYDNEIKTFMTREKFIQFIFDRINNILPIKDVFISDSPYIDNIRFANYGNN